MRWHGQAIVEMALITPVLLFIVVGGLQVGMIMLTRLELSHAIAEAAVAGAIEPEPSQRCEVAEAVANEFFEGELDIKCAEPGNFIRVTATHGLELFFPVIGPTLNIEVTHQAVRRY
jgi:hypothetical protein